MHQALHKAKELRAWAGEGRGSSKTLSHSDKYIPEENYFMSGPQLLNHTKKWYH